MGNEEDKVRNRVLKYETSSATCESVPRRDPIMKAVFLLDFAII